MMWLKQVMGGLALSWMAGCVVSPVWETSGIPRSTTCPDLTGKYRSRGIVSHVPNDIGRIVVSDVVFNAIFTYQVEEREGVIEKMVDRSTRKPGIQRVISASDSYLYDNEKVDNSFVELSKIHDGYLLSAYLQSGHKLGAYPILTADGVGVKCRDGAYFIGWVTEPSSVPDGFWTTNYGSGYKRIYLDAAGNMVIEKSDAIRGVSLGFIKGASQTVTTRVTFPRCCPVQPSK